MPFAKFRARAGDQGCHWLCQCLRGIRVVVSPKNTGRASATRAERRFETKPSWTAPLLVNCPVFSGINQISSPPGFYAGGEALERSKSEKEEPPVNAQGHDHHGANKLPE